MRVFKSRGPGCCVPSGRDTNLTGGRARGPGSWARPYPPPRRRGARPPPPRLIFPVRPSLVPSTRSAQENQDDAVASQEPVERQCPCPCWRVTLRAVMSAKAQRCRVASMEGNAHFADEPVLVDGPALLPVCVSRRFGPHFLLFWCQLLSRLWPHSGDASVAAR